MRKAEEEKKRIADRKADLKAENLAAKKKENEIAT